MNITKIIEMKKGERVLRIVRNHWIVYELPVVAAFFIFVLTFFFMFWLFSHGIFGMMFFALMNVVAIWITVRTLYVGYWNGFIVTNMRVVDVDQRGFFSRTVSDAPYDKIQDVSYRTEGMLGVFNIGTVELQTAGSSATLDLVNVLDPKSVHHLITDSMSAYIHAHGRVGGREDKVASLLEAAAELNESEARAFLGSLKQAISDGQRRAADEKRAAHPDLDKDMKWYGDEREGEEEG